MVPQRGRQLSYRMAGFRVANTEAAGLLNTIILPVASRDEADVVATTARTRDEQRNVRIIDRMPTLSSGVLYTLMDRESAARWYAPGAFEPEPANQPYNGWTNYATWATDLWITNDREGYDAAHAAIANGGPDALRAYVRSLPDIQRALTGQEPVPTSGLAADLYEDEQQTPARRATARGSCATLSPRSTGRRSPKPCARSSALASARRSTRGPIHATSDTVWRARDASCAGEVMHDGRSPPLHIAAALGMLRADSPVPAVTPVGVGDGKGGQRDAGRSRTRMWRGAAHAITAGGAADPTSWVISP